MTLWLLVDPVPSVSHVIVLPQDPSAAPPPGMTPSAVPDPSQDDAMGDLFSAGGNMGMYVTLGLYSAPVSAICYTRPVAQVRTDLFVACEVETV